MYRLRFDVGSDLEGLDVTLRSIGVGEFLDIASASKRAGEGDNPEDAGSLFEALARNLVDWNVEDEVCAEHAAEECWQCGADAELRRIPVPPTLEGVRSRDVPMVMEIMKRWMSSMAEVNVPLGQNSTAGAPSAPAAPPMEVSTPSPLN